MAAKLSALALTLTFALPALAIDPSCPEHLAHLVEKFDDLARMQAQFDDMQAISGKHTVAMTLSDGIDDLKSELKGDAGEHFEPMMKQALDRRNQAAGGGEGKTPTVSSTIGAGLEEGLRNRVINAAYFTGKHDSDPYKAMRAALREKNALMVDGILEASEHAEVAESVLNSPTYDPRIDFEREADESQSSGTNSFIYVAMSEGMEQAAEKLAKHPHYKPDQNAMNYAVKNYPRIAEILVDHNLSVSPELLAESIKDKRPGALDFAKKLLAKDTGLASKDDVFAAVVSTGDHELIQKLLDGRKGGSKTKEVELLKVAIDTDDEKLWQMLVEAQATPTEDTLTYAIEKLHVQRAKDAAFAGAGVKDSHIKLAKDKLKAEKDKDRAAKWKDILKFLERNKVGT